MSEQTEFESVAPMDDQEQDAIVASVAQGQQELDKSAQDMFEDVQDVAAIDEIANHMESAPAGVDTCAGQAIGVALEHMLKRHGLARQFSFEEYATMRTRQKQSTIAVEALRDSVKAIWQKILEAVRAALRWIKEAYQRLRLFDAFIDKKHEQFEEKFKATKAEGRDTGGNEVRLTAVSRILNVGGRAPKAGEMIALFKQHSKTVQELYEQGGKSETEVVNSIESCISDMEHGSDKFQTNLNKGIAACFEVPTSFHRSRDQKFFGDLSKETTVYEHELTFAQKSLFKTGSSSPNKAQVEDVRYKLANGTAFREFDPSSLVFGSLDNHELTELSAALNSHKSQIRRVATNRRAGNINYLSTLEKKLNHLINHQTDTIRKDTARIGQISKLISRTKTIMATDDVHLISYDNEVHSTLLTYMIACTFAQHD